MKPQFYSSYGPTADILKLAATQAAAHIAAQTLSSCSAEAPGAAATAAVTCSTKPPPPPLLGTPPRLTSVATYSIAARHASVLLYRRIPHLSRSQVRVTRPLATVIPGSSFNQLVRAPHVAPRSDNANIAGMSEFLDSHKRRWCTGHHSHRLLRAHSIRELGWRIAAVNPAHQVIQARRRGRRTNRGMERCISLYQKIYQTEAGQMISSVSSKRKDINDGRIAVAPAVVEREIQEGLSVTSSWITRRTALSKRPRRR